MLLSRQRCGAVLASLTFVLLAACGSLGGASPARSTAPARPGNPSASVLRSPSPRPSAIAGPGACALVTKPELEAATGKRFDPPRIRTAAHCQYAGVDALGVVDISVSPGAQTYNAVKKAFRGGAEVGGLGDAAYWSRSAGLLAVLSRGHTLQVQLILISNSEAVSLKVATALARGAIARL